MVDTKVPSWEHTIEPMLKILIVEDNPGDILILKERLTASGARFSITNVSMLKEAFSELKTGNFDVVLLDLGLPDSLGIDSLKTILSFEPGPPVVVMTGMDDEDMALASLREGAQDYIVKNSLDPENILRSIRYSIERKKLENLRKKNSRQLAILSGTTASLYDGDDTSSIYSMICKSIRQLIDRSLVVSIEFNNEFSFRIANNEQFRLWSSEIESLIGLKLDSMVFSLVDQKKELVRMFMDGNIHYVNGGISEILGGKISYEKCSRLEALTGAKHAYTIGFLKNESYYGGIIIFTERLLEDDDMKFIENLCSQASLSIHRRIIKKNLIQSEAKYQKLAEELEQKVKERTIELEVANEQLRHSEAQLKELNATKDKFFNIVAHDLKNPFTSLLGATEILFHNIQNMDREKIRKLAQILNDSAKSGYAILLNLLDWSRSQTGTIKINLQKISLGKLIEDNIAELQLNSIDKQILLTSEIREDINIIADKNMLNTILRNLLSNAIKFTPRGGKIVVRTQACSDEVTISVQDTGIGISDDNIDKLFRIDSKYTRPGTEKELGTGLGLKLSKEFVEKLGGKIWVRSSENIGSEFSFSIPLQGNTVISNYSDLVMP
jgi:signal transduction histidine kinase/DNA-binding NarL/FixJ family response regulator